MSRHIQTANPENRKLNNQSQNGKLILTCIKDRALALLLQNDILISAQTLNNADTEQVGEIYIGKVKNIVQNIDSCFVEIKSGMNCYLSLKDAQSAYILNRSSNLKNADGSVRLVQGDELPVQIIREALKTKPAAVTTALELHSDYFVFKAGNPGFGISNKISKSKSSRIIDLFIDKGLISGKQVLQEEGVPDFGVILRTKGQESDDEQLIEEYLKQRESFLDLYHKARYRTCFSCILEKESPMISAVKEIPTHEYDEIITDVPEFYDILSERDEILKPVRLYEDAFSLASLYGLNTKLDNAFSTKVWLKSGANLVIEQTECLTAIDVNTGKNIKGRITEDTILQVNKEAAKEAAIQIRLRNLSGIIIIDFINMKTKEHEEELLNYLRELTAGDPVTTKVVDMTPLGLVEITRKKINMSLKEQFK